MSERVPDGWIVEQMSSICEVIGGGTPERAKSMYWGGDIPWVSPTEITSLNTRYISTTKEGITILGLNKSSAKLHPVGTVLMTSRASIGYAAINTIPMATNQGFQSLQCGDKVANEFLYQYITWFRPSLEKLSAGSTFSEISSANVKKVKLTLPPLPEQKKIAAILSSVDEVIEKNQAQINKLKDLKTGMMQELLTRGIGHTEFKDSAVGRIPVGWEVVTANDVSNEIQVGVVVKPTQYYVDSGVPALRSANVREGGLTSDNLKYFSPESNEILKKSKLVVGDLLTVRTGYPGTTAVVTEEFDGVNCIDVVITRPKHTILPNYFSMWVNSDKGKGQVLKVQGGLAQQHFNVGDMKKLLVALPSLKEQQEIFKAIHSITERINFAKSSFNSYLSLKKALMQDLLTGKVRVKVDG